MDESFCGNESDLRDCTPVLLNEGDYKALFAHSEFVTMAVPLAHIKRRFVLSLNDRLEVRGIFSRFHIEAIDVSHSISRAGSNVAR